MTDETSWQSPGPSGMTPDPSTRPPAPPVPPGPVPGYGPQNGRQAASGAPQGWTPPPKPGLIPLRPLSFGTILAAPYQLLRRNPRPTYGISLLVQAVVAVVSTGIIGGVSFAALGRVDFSETAGDADTILAGSIAAIGLSALIPVALSIVASGVLQGIVVLEASRQTIGEKLRLPQLWSRAKGRVFVVAGYTALLTLALIVAVAVIVGVAVGLGSLGSGGIAAAVVAAILLGLGLIVGMAWISTKLAFVPSVIMLERASLASAVRRSWRLTGGSFWRLFGTIVLVAVILNVATSIITFPVQLIAGILPTVFAATGDDSVELVIFVGLNVLAIAIGVAVGALALVIQSATTALLYIDQRMRREGLDLALIDYVESRQAGRSDLADPYAVEAGRPGATPPPGGSPWA